MYVCRDSLDVEVGGARIPEFWKSGIPAVRNARVSGIMATPLLAGYYRFPRGRRGALSYLLDHTSGTGRLRVMSISKNAEYPKGASRNSAMLQHHYSGARNSEIAGFRNYGIPQVVSRRRDRIFASWDSAVVYRASEAGYMRRTRTSEL